MKKVIKNIVNLISPELGKQARISKLKKILTSLPQITSDGLRFRGAQIYDNYEPSVCKVLTHLMKYCRVFVNVGANHGVYCLVPRYFQWEGGGLTGGG